MAGAEAQRGAAARTVRVVLAAHDEQLRARMRDALTAMAGVWVIGEAVEVTAAVVICTLGKPHVVVMDALFPWDEGSVIARRLRTLESVPTIIACRLSPSRDLLAAPVTLGLAVADGVWVGLPSLVRCGGPSPRGPAG
jgi:AmiR/NasT family two-component response regulator